MQARFGHLSLGRRFLLVLLGLLLATMATVAGAVWWSGRRMGACNPPSLLIGTEEYRIEEITPAVDGSINIPNSKPNTAFWVQGTTAKYIFGISPSVRSLETVSHLKRGDMIAIRWADCGKEEYTFDRTDPIGTGKAVIAGQSGGGITVFLSTNATNWGPVVRAGQSVQVSLETPVVDASGPQFNIALLDPIPSTDPAEVIIGLSLTNIGKETMTVTQQDISLQAENGPQLNALSVEPALPQEVKPGDEITLTVTFPSPGTSIAVLRILDATFDYYF